MEDRRSRGYAVPGLRFSEGKNRRQIPRYGKRPSAEPDVVNSIELEGPRHSACLFSPKTRFRLAGNQLGLRCLRMMYQTYFPCQSDYH